jgi:hypothetical protein
MASQRLRVIEGLRFWIDDYTNSGPVRRAGAWHEDPHSPGSRHAVGRTNILPVDELERAIVDHIALYQETGNCGGLVPVHTRHGLKIHAAALEWPPGTGRPGSRTRCGVQLSDFVSNLRLSGGLRQVTCAHCPRK